MKKAIIFAAAAAILATPAVAEEKPEKEKCYGVAKGGKNDCGWAGGSCAGSAKNDAEKGAWLLLPKGLCEKLAGGSLTAPANQFFDIIFVSVTY